MVSEMVIHTSRPDAMDQLDCTMAPVDQAQSSRTPMETALIALPAVKKCVLKVSCCLKKNREARLECALLRSIQQAKSQFRLRLGLCQSLRILEFEPESVVICVLPVNEADQDSLSHVQLLLIEAYCHEHSIRMLKVHSPEKLWNIVKYSNETDVEDEGGSDDEEDHRDDGIVLLLRSHTKNELDEDLLQLYDDEYTRGNSSPELTFPGGKM